MDFSCNSGDLAFIRFGYRGPAECESRVCVVHRGIRNNCARRARVSFAAGVGDANEANADRSPALCGNVACIFFVGLFVSAPHSFGKGNIRSKSPGTSRDVRGARRKLFKIRTACGSPSRFFPRGILPRIFEIARRGPAHCPASRGYNFSARIWASARRNIRGV